MLCWFLDAGNDETLGRLSWPASKKRQCTMSPDVCGSCAAGALSGICRGFGVAEIGLKRSPRSACGQAWSDTSV
jgi:hypothetical protein